MHKTQYIFRYIMNNRRDFLKKVALAGTSAVIGSQIEALGSNGVSSSFSGTSEGGGLIVPKSNGLKITGTFLDEISHDIPHQNWGEKEWDRDFRYMKAIGIDTVILIRSGYKKFITYPSKYLLSKGCYMPSVDLVDMFLRLAEKYGMKFWFGLYDSGKFWETRDMTYEIEHNKYVIDEVWKNYGKYKSFGGWYISGEISRQTKGAIGYVGLAYVSPRIKTLSISYDGEHYATPTVENATNKTYPIVRPLYYYYDAKNKTQIAPLLEFILSPEGQDIIKKSGYIPVK